MIYWLDYNFKRTIGKKESGTYDRKVYCLDCKFEFTPKSHIKTKCPKCKYNCIHIFEQRGNNPAKQCVRCAALEKEFK